MGCRSSKAEDLPLVSLCRQRRDLIRAAAEHRYALAAAHSSYFLAIDRVGDALHRFVAEELTAAPTSAPPSPVLTLPPSDGKSKSKSDSFDGIDGNAGGSSSISECSHVDFAPCSDSEEGSDERQYSSFRNPNHYYMNSSSTIPSTIYFDPGNAGYGYPNSYYYYDYPSVIGTPVENAAASTAPPPSPPSPPPPEGSSWDFFNVFDSYEQILPEYLRGRFGWGSMVSSPNSSEIREKEGIPELEEETEPESMKGLEKEKKEEVAGNLGGIGSSKAAPLEETIVHKGSVGREEISREEEEEEESYAREKEVSFEEKEPSLVMEESGSSDGIALHVHGMRDVAEAVEEIKEQFKLAAGCGEEVSRLLEVGKMQHRSGRRLLKVIFSRILDFMALSTPTSSRHSSNHLQHMTASVSKVESVNSEYTSVKSGNLSSTLEKLYLWEKKLYKEVKDEEKLRAIYERECSRLTVLDNGGAESDKIDTSLAVIRKLLTKISIAIKSVDVISSRIHKLRDEELRPQLIELIQGLMRMWKFMLDCHRKQFQAIVESKTHNLTARTRIQRDSVAKATMDLEQELLNWCACFNNWIRTQKAYIGALNDWLMKWLLREQTETPDGLAPFSPSRIGAPAAFIISSDWHHAVETLSDVGVMTSMHIFAANVHKLWESQDEEQRQKLKAEYLTRDFSRKLRSLQTEASVHKPLDASDKRAMPVSSNSEAYDDIHLMALDSMKKRLDEERAKHQETMKQLQDAASGSLQMGLVPVFEALGNYALETVNAYGEIRIPITCEGT